MILGNNNQPNNAMRSSDGHLCHPAHRPFHLLRLLVGSLLGGWTLVLVMLVLGFLGNITFASTVTLASKWVFIAGSIAGVLLGALFSLVAAILGKAIPPLRQSLHPLAVVRAGFVFLAAWSVLALMAWPAVSGAFWMIWLSPVLAAIIAIMAVRGNPHADLVPHSTIGRAIGTAIGPFMIFAIFLSMLIPMYNRGLGSPSPAKLIFVAVDGVDGSTVKQFISSSENERLPNLLRMRTEGNIGAVETSQPIIPSSLWAKTMTGVDVTGIQDSFSTSDDLTATPMWELLASKNMKVGLFQMLPPHKKIEGALFDVASPGSPGAETDPRSSTLDELRNLGAADGLTAAQQAPALVMRLARLGVRLDTITAMVRELLWEIVVEPSPRLVYAQRKLLQFRVEADTVFGLMRFYHADAVFLRFPSLGPLFKDYWQFAHQQDFGLPPKDVDFAMMAGLARVLPDATRLIDSLVEQLQPFREPNTVFCIVSDHGERSASSPRTVNFGIDPEKLLEISGMKDELIADTCGESVCIRLSKSALEEKQEADATTAPVDESFIGPPAPRPDPLGNLESLLKSATWVNIDNPSLTHGLFAVSRYPERIEVSIRPTGEITPKAIATIGTWTDQLSGLAASGGPKYAVAGGPGFFAIEGLQFKRGAVPSSANLFDIMPTVLEAMSVELSQEFAGHALNDLFDPAWLGSNPPSYVPNYKLPPPPPPPPPTPEKVEEQNDGTTTSSPEVEPLEPNSEESGTAGSRV